MYLVLCPSSDVSALWAYEGLRQLGVAPLELVLSERLAHGTRWEHRLDRSGTHLKITLPDGRVLCSSRIRGVINRLLTPAPSIAQQAAASDKEYVQAELHAFYLSWLNALPGVVINRATPVGLSGAWYHPSEWAYRAGRAGLPVRAYRQSSEDAPEQCYATQAPQGSVTRTVITFRGEVFGGAVAAPIARGCARLADDAGAEMLGIDLYLDAEGAWCFASASTLPDLSLGGLPLLRRLAGTLTEGGRL